VVWQLAVRAPDRVAGVVGMSVPFVPRTPVPPTQLLEAAFPDGAMYILQFQEPGVAERQLGRDLRATMSRALIDLCGDAPHGAGGRVVRDLPSWLKQVSEPASLPSWLTQEDVDHYVSEFSRTGFTGGLNWYRNLDRNWELTSDLAGAHVQPPAFFIAGERDVITRMTPPQIMDGWVDDLRRSILIRGAGHWVQQERPDEVNAALLEFLAEIGW
jgi:pimeloyl-ACP methyl ester carboxylesterase